MYRFKRFFIFRPFVGKHQWQQKLKEEEPIDILDFMDSSESTSWLDEKEIGVSCGWK